MSSNRHQMLDMSTLLDAGLPHASPLSVALETTARHITAEPAQPVIRLAGLKGAAPAFFIARHLQQTPQPTLCVLPSDKQAETFAADLGFFIGQALAPRVRYYPAWDVTVADGLSPNSDVIAAQIEGLYDVLSVATPILVTSTSALLQRLLPQEEFITATFRLRIGDELPLSAFVDYCLQWGYRRVPLVEEKGEISVRGGIVDLFPPLAQHPLRVEFLGDSVETMRSFDPASQRSLDTCEEIMVLPMRFFSVARLQAAWRTIEEALDAGDIPHREQQRIIENLKSGLPFPGVEFFLPYLYPDLEHVSEYLPRGTVVWALDPAEQERAAATFWEQLESRVATAREAGRFVPPPERYYLPAKQAVDGRAAFLTVEVRGLETVEKSKRPLQPDKKAGDVHSSADCTVTSTLHMGLKPGASPPGAEKSLAPLVARIRQWQDERQQVYLTVSSQGQADHLQHLLLGYELELPVEPAWDAQGGKSNRPLQSDKKAGTVTLLEGQHSRTAIVVGHLSQGFGLPADGLVFLAEEEIFGERRHRRRSRPRPVADYLTGLGQLAAGDYVVHTDHGIARYHGLQHLSVADTTGDYLHLEYTGGDKLYVPVERINLVQKYAGADGKEPSLDRLGGQTWERVKRKTREAIQAMARELLEIHAVRESVERPALVTYTSDYEEFVARFPFEETRGQRAAIEDVEADLQSPKPMDRLVCGDVGYGKTEVALRAAYLAVENGKQVAVLVPTTVLAQQHAETFSRRFADSPIRVELLNRFRSAQDVKAVVRGLAAGTVDIVIGTHRLLQRDIGFKELGLVVIDEEHRFGVTHKEKIKRLRHEVDVLTLSATPIPRSLNMGMMGLRDLSVIETPPVDRQAIRTYVARFDEDLIRSAILQELARGGQVFFVHNRVESIEKMAEQLRALVPEAVLAVAHGQMGERELETVMLDFMHHRVNVLLCSAIIESGLDIPTANTIIINRADRFGLAQLYQLRGRVGRSAMRAYAYLLIPGEHTLTRDAQRRLEVLQELDDLGGGFRLAAHDLEIRGAGNLLGKEQSGRVAAIGYELYADMLEETVRELRGGEIEVAIEPDIHIGLPAYLPEAYIPDVNQRLVFYKKLANVQERSDLEDLAYEMEDRFGPLPALVLDFIEVMDLRRVLRHYFVTAVYRKGERVTLHFHPDSPIPGERLVAFIQRNDRGAQLSPDGRISFSLAPQEDVMQAVKTLLHSLSESC